MMDKNQENIAVSALYTAGVWQWARFGGADIATPKDAGTVFKVVNAFHRFYRWINPLTYSLRHQLLHRHAAIDRLIADSGCTQVLEVASGFSARGLRFSAEPKLRYVEIDLPDMVAAKRRQLARSAAGSAALARPNLEIRAGDVFEIDYAAESARAPTAVVTEGLMMYLRRDQQMPLWKKIADALRVRGGVYLFDYIPLSEEPPRSLLGRLLQFFFAKVLRMRGDFAYDQRNRDEVASDLRAAGFERVEIVDTGEVARRWHLAHAEVPTRTLIYRCRVDAQRAPAADAGQ